MADPIRKSGEPDEAIFAKLRAEVAAARSDLIHAAEPGAPWTCTHCDQPLSSPLPGEWLDPAELRRQANRSNEHSGPAMMIATANMVKEGVMELGTDLRIRLRGKRP